MTDNIYGKQRKSDSDPMKRFWDWATPWAQIIGFIVMCSFVVGSNYSKFEVQAKDIGEIKQDLANHTIRINALEMANSRIDQKLEDIIIYFGIPHREHN